MLDCGIASMIFVRSLIQKGMTLPNFSYCKCSDGQFLTHTVVLQWENVVENMKAKVKHNVVLIRAPRGIRYTIWQYNRKRSKHAYIQNLTLYIYS